jgi:hypothetical protein
MQILIWIGAAVTLAGLGGLVWCILSVIRARRAGLPDDQLRVRLQRIVVWNLGALFLSVMGLMLVVVGIVFG